jgi:hypothetical protein
MRGIKALFLGLMALAVSALCVSVYAQEIDDSTKEQLRQLKEICDGGLVSPEVCKEKQRDILGLRGSSGSVLKNLEQLQSQLPPPVVQPHASTIDRLEDGGQQPRRITVTLPSGWTQLGIEGLQAGHGALLQPVEEDPEAKGRLELVEASTASAAGVHFRNYGDTLHVSRFSHALMLDPARAEKTCKILADRARSGQSPALLDCGIRQIGGLPALYVEKDSLRHEVRVIQLWVAKSPEETFQFFLRCKTERLATRKKELEDIVASVQWQ